MNGRSPASRGPLFPTADFHGGRAGAQFVANVTPYEKMKIRLLNAGHSVLGILGSVYGLKTIDECVSDDLFATLLRKFMDREATPVLDAVEGTSAFHLYRVLLLGVYPFTHNISQRVLI
jgi:mannitol-1-phosphate/altronate dehydrogenase